MNETWKRYGPVVVSIVVIILIAILRQRSKVLAAITATMPMNVTLALWLVYAAEGTSATDVIAFVKSLLVGVVGTFFWLLAVWLAARAGFGLVWLILVGYAAWAVLLVAVFIIQWVGGPKLLPLDGF